MLEPNDSLASSIATISSGVSPEISMNHLIEVPKTIQPRNERNQNIHTPSNIAVSKN